MGLLSGRRFLIVGVANTHSIATGIAEAMHREGARLAFSYQDDRLLKRVKPIAERLDGELLVKCDVSSKESIGEMRDAVVKTFGEVDGIVHSVGFAPANELARDWLQSTTIDGFTYAMNVSAYSFIELAKSFHEHLSDDAALLTLTYIGANLALPNYNTMGLAKAALESATRYLATHMGPDGTRVNAISAGAIPTLASQGVPHFRKLLATGRTRAPLRRNVTPADVGNAAAFLCSPLAAGVTGTVLYVDAGLHTTLVSEDDIQG